jgi:hypothetical protein
MSIRGLWVACLSADCGWHVYPWTVGGPRIDMSPTVRGYTCHPQSADRHATHSDTLSSESGEYIRMELLFQSASIIKKIPLSSLVLLNPGIVILLKCTLDLDSSPGWIKPKTSHYKMVIRFFSTEHAVLLSKSEVDWLAWNQDNVSNGATCLPAYCCFLFLVHE